MRGRGLLVAGGVIAAIDTATDKQLWAVQLYETTFDAAEERDAQEVYVSELKIDAKSKTLIATDERKRRWQIKLADHTVSLMPALAIKK